MAVDALKMCGLGCPLCLILRPRCCSGSEFEWALATIETRVLLSIVSVINSYGGVGFVLDNPVRLIYIARVVMDIVRLYAVL
jgi:uncharacterized membrane protein